jgi:hypothetical protein
LNIVPLSRISLFPWPRQIREPVADPQHAEGGPKKAGRLPGMTYTAHKEVEDKRPNLKDRGLQNEVALPSGGGS